ncbi:hypothetical protein [Pseudomonas sp.]|jgi:hypothetical protein|uniref:hypothetical protein n=1 Tax=Pseudomonas sp. TaxID=306 RepID=UPI002E36045A|nr:hypothetical protein [Pseudomonas sp.]HEX4548528.1 hypothetical protein [Pseudomonas sp.]
MTDSTDLPSDEPIDFVLKIVGPENNSVLRGPLMAVVGTMVPTGLFLPITIYEVVNGEHRVIGHSPPFAGIFWMAAFLATSGRKTIIAKVLGVESIQSDPVTFEYVFEAVINILQPTQGATVGPVGELVITGSGISGKTIDLMTPDESVRLGTAVVGEDHLWRVVLDQSLYPQGGQVQMKAGHRGMNDWTSTRMFYLIPTARPVITRPVHNDPVDVRGIISGTGQPGSTVTVLRDLQHDYVVGSGSVGEDKQWQVTEWVNGMAPGPFGIVARQTFDGRDINSDPRHFNVRPPAFTQVNIDYPTSNTIGFSGSGYYKAGTITWVEIRFKVGAPVDLPPRKQVDATGRWETTATNWPMGNYSLIAVQMVSDLAGGWIESTPYEFEVKKGLPDVTGVTYTQDYQPTFSGRGTSGARVYIAFPGGAEAAPIPNVSSTGQWESRASVNWGPYKNRRVLFQQIKQDVPSSGFVELLVTIAPLPPEIQTPPAYGLTPEFTGTCWENSPVTLTFSDSPTEYTVNGSNHTWRFRRPEAFPSGVPCTISAQQRAAEQTSGKKSLTFTVRRPMTAPQITLPAENAEVGHEIIVQGNGGMKDATLQLRDANNKKPLGEAKVLSSDGDWTITLSDLDFERYGSNSIEAIQTIAPDTSDAGDRRTFTVVVKPPVIEVPANGQSLTRTSTISGKGRPSATVELEIGGQHYRNIPVNGEGLWEIQLTLAVGSKTLNAQVLFNDVRSENQTVQYNVVPAAPFIETPALGEHVGRFAVVSGFGVPGDTVSARLGNAQGRVLGESPVLLDRTWSVDVEFDQPGGQFGVVAVASCDGFSSADSEARPVNLGTFAPTVEQPAAGRWVANPVGFKGQGRPGLATLVSWFNPENVWAPSLPVNGSGWQGEANAPLPPGGQWARVRQTITDGADGATHSDWVDSSRFETLPPEPEG